MGILSQIALTTLLGLSLLFVGGFVLWVYGSQPRPLYFDGPTDEAAKKLQGYLRHWFFMYGALACFAGAGLMLTAMFMAV